MNHRDLWFVGLLALAYLYLDGTGSAAPSEAQVRSEPLPPFEDDSTEEPFALAADACPRDFAHPISLRADGAMWCLTCDEGFYPVGLVM
jgi:hypothetical protein